MNIADLLHDAVDGVEPAERIEEIRARTANAERSAARPWFYAAGATVLATAAAVTAFAVLGGDPAPESGHHHDHVATSPSAETHLVPVYFVGAGPQGDRLFREFDQATGADPLNAAVARVQQPPIDPDYRTAWPPGSFASATADDDSIDVELGTAEWDVSELAIQQLVYTLQGAAQERLPIQLVRDGEPVRPPYQALPELEVLNLVSISDPAEGSTYSGSFTARGRASSYEGNVPWEIRRAEDDEVVLTGFATALGYLDRLYKWETEVDVSGLAPGAYTFYAFTADPSGGAEGSLLFQDTRAITVR